MGQVEQIDGRYRVLRELGEGLFGDVYLVHDGTQEWALKLLKADLESLNQTETLAVFKKEFLLLRELHHPGIAAIGDFGLDRALNRYYFTSEYIAGADLWDASQGASYAEIEELIVQALRALQYLHQYGIVHGDIKPENILVTREQGAQLKLIDFGVAVFKEAGKIMGSPTYLAPEVFLGAAASAASDLYALGVVFYTLLARRNPFKGDDLNDTILRHKTVTPAPIHTLAPKVPAYLQHVIERLLDKNPSARYAQAAAVIQDLNFVSGKHYAIETEISRHAYMPFNKKLIGREKEMGIFTAARHAIFAEKSLTAERLLILSGEAGLGKSRLLAEFKSDAQVNEIPVVSVERVEPLDIKGPCLVVIPTLDPFPENIVLDILRQAMSGEVLVVAAAQEALRPWHERLPATRVLKLEPFGREAIGALLQELFQGIALSPDFVTSIHTLTQGNLLFIEEIVRKLVDEAWRFDPSGKWDEETLVHLGEFLKKTDVPGTLGELLHNRLAQLPDPDLMLVIALFNRPMSVAELMALVKEDSISQRVLALSAAGWIVRDADTALWSMRNPLLAKQLLAECDPKQRAHWEEKIGIMLAQKNDKDPQALYYLSHSDNRDVARQAAEGAYTYYWQSEDYATANQFLERVLALSNDLPVEQVVEFKLRKSECLSRLREFDDAIALLTDCLEELGTLSLNDENLGQRLECFKSMGSIYLKMGKPGNAFEAYQSGLALASLLKDDVTFRLFFENAKAHVKVQEGALDAALKIFHNSWQEWLWLPKDKQALVLNHDLGRTLFLSGKYQQAAEQLLSELNCYQAAGNFFFEARAHYHLADTDMALEKWDEAVQHFEQAIAIAKEHHVYELLIRLYNGLGNLYQLRQDLPNGIAAYEKALRYTRKIQDTSAMAGVLTNLGILYRRANKIHDAFSHLTCAVHLIAQLPLRRVYELHCLARSHLELGNYYFQIRDFKKAEDHGRDALSLCTTHAGIQSLLPWVYEQLIQTVLEAAPTNADLPEWFIAWEKIEPDLRNDEKSGFNRLYKRWLTTHGMSSPAPKTSDPTYTSDVHCLENLHDDTSGVLDKTAVVSVDKMPGDPSFLNWQAFEAAYIAQTLFENRFHITNSAKILKLTRATLYRKLYLYKLDKFDPFSKALNVSLTVPLGFGLKQALFRVVYPIVCDDSHKKQLPILLGMSQARIDRLIGKGKREGWEPLAQR